MGKKLSGIIVGVFLALASSATADGDVGRSAGIPFPEHLKRSEWELIWHDDFLGEQIDGTKWRHCPEWDRCEGQCKWSEQDAYVDGKGNLMLRIRKRDGRIFSGAVRTKGLFEKKFGYFEIRCKMPPIKGGWCAFWMMPAAGSPVGDEGRDGTEIDVFESIDSENGNGNHALHWDGYGKDLKSQVHRVENRPDLYGGYHSFAVLWNEKEYVFYIDDKESWRSSAGGVMQVPAYMKITMEAAKWAGDIHKDELPKFMLVDYVRVYSLKETPNMESNGADAGDPQRPALDL